MALPKTMDDLVPSGYKFDNASTCKRCGDDIEWWVTPKGSNLPMNPMDRGSDPAVTHMSTCTGGS